MVRDLSCLNWAFSLTGCSHVSWTIRLFIIATHRYSAMLVFVKLWIVSDHLFTRSAFFYKTPCWQINGWNHISMAETLWRQEVSYTGVFKIKGRDQPGDGSKRQSNQYTQYKYSFIYSCYIWLWKKCIDQVIMIKICLLQASLTKTWKHRFQSESLFVW